MNKKIPENSLLAMYIYIMILSISNNWLYIIMNDIYVIINQKFPYGINIY